MSRQYVQIRFRPSDKRTWTYHNDGPRVAKGDRVKVPGRFGDGWQAVEVVDWHDDEPAFTTKAILGLVDGEAIDEKLLKAGVAEPYKPDLFS